MKFLASLDNFIPEHTAVSWVVWVLGSMVLMRPVGLLAVAPDETRFGWMAWVVVFYLIVTPILVVTFDRAVRGQEVPILASRWVMAQSPIFLTLAAVIVDRSPQFPISAALAEAIVLMIFALRRARRGETLRRARHSRRSYGTHEPPNWQLQPTAFGG